MQLKYHMVTIEDLVPQEHFLRKLEHVLDMSFVQEETAHLYSRKYGRPPIDPVVMVKYLLVGFLYGIPSERQIEQRIQTDVALRWYLGLDLFDRVPDHSTISQLRRRKPSFRKVFRRLFEEVVRQCVEKGLVSGRLVVTDSTHMKANAAVSSEELVEIKEAPGVYWERLDAYEEEGLEKLKEKTGKRRKKRVKQIKKTIRRSHKRVSHTDPDAGHMKRPGKPEGPQYLVHEATDSDNGFIVDVVVTGGDSSDSAPYLDQIERINKNVVPIQAALSGLNTSALLRHSIMGVNIQPSPPDTYAALLRELSAIGNNVNQIAYWANATKGIGKAEIAEAAALVRQAWRMVPPSSPPAGTMCSGWTAWARATPRPTSGNGWRRRETAKSTNCRNSRRPPHPPYLPRALFPR